MKPSVPKPPAIKFEKPEDEVMSPVQGRMPDSLNEWRVAMALDQLGWEYRFQYPIAGGRDVRGGVVVDFVIFNSQTYAVAVGAEGYWHNARTASEDRLKEAAAVSRGYIWVDLNLDDTETIQTAKNALRKKVSL